MALITIQRSALNDTSQQQLSYEINTSNGGEDQTDYNCCLAKITNVNKCYFAVRGAAIILPHNQCMHGYKAVAKTPTNDIQQHLQNMLFVLRPEDTLKMAVKLESVHPKRNRYLIVVTLPQTEESCLLGIDCNHQTTIGLVLPSYADTRITLDGDGGFSITSNGRHHIFKPVSVQAMWSALQALHKASTKAQEKKFFYGGGSHDWISYYEQRVNSDRSCLNEWNAMDDIEYKRPPSPDVRTKPSEQVAIEQLIRAKLKEVMMSVDLDEVTSKYIRTKLETELDIDLSCYKPFIDEEMLTILGQMDEPSEIFEYLFLGSEWNASNLEELKGKGVAKILNVAREIDNFFPGTFDYFNVRVYDDDSTEMLKYWDKTFKYIRKAKEEGSKVLVHCKRGISRSASVVLAFVMKETGWSLEKTYEYVKNKRNCIRPNSGFLKQLEIYQGILDASYFRMRLPNDTQKPAVKKIDTQESLGVVRRLTKEFQEKAKGTVLTECSNNNNNNNGGETKTSLSMPSSPNVNNRNSRPRSSTFNEYMNAQNTPLLPFIKTNMDFSIKQNKIQTTDDFRIRNINNNMEIISTSSSIMLKTSKISFLPKINHQSVQASVNMIGIKTGGDLLKRTPPKKLQQGRSHPLTKLMPQNSKCKNSGSLLNTM